MCFGMALFGLGGFMLVSRPQDDLPLREKLKVMSCSFSHLAVMYLTAVSASFCIAPGYQFAIPQVEKDLKWTLTVDFMLYHRLVHPCCFKFALCCCSYNFKRMQYIMTYPFLCRLSKSMQLYAYFENNCSKFKSTVWIAVRNILTPLFFLLLFGKLSSRLNKLSLCNLHNSTAKELRWATGNTLKLKNSVFCSFYLLYQ